MYYYKQIKDGKIISVEAKSVDIASSNFIKTTKTAYDTFVASLPEPPLRPPQRNALAEIDEIKARLSKLEEPIAIG